MEKNLQNGIQTLVLEDKKKLSLSGVSAVEGFTDEKIRLTAMTGGVVITGEKLKINSFSEGTGAFSCEGVINSVVFAAKKQGLLKRILK